MKTNDTFVVQPDIDAPLTALIRQGMLQGAGRPASDGPTAPWTVHDLESAFDTRGRSVSTKSLENWRSGRNLPSPRNLHVLAHIFGGNHSASQRAWLDALLDARAAAGSPTKPATRETAIEVLDEAADIRKTARRSWPVMVTASLFGVAVLGLGAIVMTRGSPGSQAGPVITDIRFCDEAGFDRDSKRCTASRDAFPEGTPLIHVSFESAPLPDGHPFTRSWYRDGQKYLERDGFFDAVWENWTWVREEPGHQAGDYHIRIVVDDRSYAAGFRVETSQYSE